ncbi:Vegetative incompatibility protein HET-E-1-like protein 10 [Colletotrichum chlorophyti]|uniref:Vegetative incompatibility protein HET-E-1-like protein 10 n=1 Tax=Colletotrichum chlorophyti TaxID=708187 RepID=A0A1Q8S3M7_9PEZI|nr:Vegetative incompatibility protein HET-E-1-like protein 10 [Colletotrichum chlorophyti]
MWLINTETLKLDEVVDASSVKYAILSHTWEDDEVSFRDISCLESAKQKAGFSKIAKTCELARERNLRYAWVDTCCIDKSSSAELSEAINSMFQWYKLSTICFVFLSDLRPLATTQLERPTSLFPYDHQTFGGCRWFSRGWTLQELIAPHNIEFYNSSWQLFSTKQLDDGCLSSLAQVTTIPVSVLNRSISLRKIPVGVKMSWAAHRQTKRVEDRAYSLLGIFDINMPMIYGEGSKAFRRLQERIARDTNDLSLFAWAPSIDTENAGAVRRRFCGIFANSPRGFSSCTNLSKSPASGWQQPVEYSLTNKGLP